MGKALMVLGTSSGAGKSLLVTALCRILSKRGGYDVVPFKSQNMSLNSAPSIEGGEISRAQYLQAIACGKRPSVRFNLFSSSPREGCGARSSSWESRWGGASPRAITCSRARRSYSGRR